MKFPAPIPEKLAEKPIESAVAEQPSVKIPTPTPFPERPFPATKSQPLPKPPPEPGPRRSEEREYQPRYIGLPPRRERGHGKRNLTGGIVLLSFAVLLLAWALHLAGPAAMLIVATCAATTLLLYVMARARLFRQRNGLFVAWSAVLLLGASLVIFHHGWLFVTGKSPEKVEKVALAAAPKSTEPAVATMKTGVEIPLLRTAFPGKDAGGPMVRIARDISVIVGGRPYMAKAGDTYPLLDVGIGELRFSAGDQEIAIPSAAGEVAAGVAGAIPEEKFAASLPSVPIKKFEGPEFIPPADLPLRDQVAASQREAVRRYPGLQKVGSPQNQLYVSAVKEQQFSGATEFFQNPNWPLELAIILAEKDGWQRADVLEEAPPASRSVGAVREKVLSAQWASSI